jgi:hypothetical protein
MPPGRCVLAKPSSNYRVSLPQLSVESEETILMGVNEKSCEPGDVQAQEKPAPLNIAKMRHPVSFHVWPELSRCVCANDALSLGCARDKLRLAHPPIRISTPPSDPCASPAVPATSRPLGRFRRAPARGWQKPPGPSRERRIKACAAHA